MSGKYRQNHFRRGIALVWTAIVLLVLILIVGLALDSARVYLAANQLQNAADAAALAGARIVRDKDYTQNDVRIQAQYIANQNYVIGGGPGGDPILLDLNSNNLSDGDIVIGRYYPSTKSFVPTDSTGTPKPNAVKVVARRTDTSHGALPLLFGPVAGIDTANVSRYAIAEGKSGFGAGLIVLSEDANEQPALSFTAGAEVEITNGGIQVNMPFENPVDKGGVGNQPRVYADEFNTVSTTDSTNGYIFDPATGLRLTTGQPKIPDPYRNVPAPTWDPVADLQSPTTVAVVATTPPLTLEPGYYPGGIKITGGDVTFEPGVYIIGGNQPTCNKGLEITGGNVCALRVMFYITECAHVKITGSPTADITITEINTDDPGNDCDGNPVTYSQGLAYVEPYNDLSIFQDRTNTEQADVGGGAGLNIHGTIYFPNNHVKLTGGSGSLGIQVVADTVRIISSGGSDRLVINYDGRYRTPADSSYLRE